MLCYKKRRAPPIEARHKQTEKYRTDIDKAMGKSLKEMGQEVRRRQNEFWDCNNLTEMKRV
jgi:hypothetical protein